MTALAQRVERPVRGAWRRLAVRSAIAPLAVLVPLTVLAPTGDHRYNVYWHGATVRNNPWTLVTENLSTIGMYLREGNFRPLGRIVEWSLDVLAYLMVEMLRLPAELALRVLAALAAVVLTGAAVVLAEAVVSRGRMFAGPPARPVTLIPFAVAAGLVAAGPMSTTVLFGGLYFLSTALVLGVAAWVCREPSRPVALLVAGAALAAFNEVAALAVPLATIALAVRLHQNKSLNRKRMRPALLLWLGFLPIFVPVRLTILVSCRADACYPGSDLMAGSGAAAALPNRLTAWLPPLQWAQALRDTTRPSQIVLLLAVVVFGLLARRAAIELGGLPALDRRQAGGLAAVGGGLLVLGALLGSLGVRGQEAVQAGGWGVGFRDSGLTAAGGALLTVGLLARWGRVEAQRFALAGLALLAAGSAAANQAYAGHANRLPVALIDNAIAGEVAQFDNSEAGDARRCALRERFAALMTGIGYPDFREKELPGTHSATERLDLTLDMATVQMYGVPFCQRSL